MRTWVWNACTLRVLISGQSGCLTGCFRAMIFWAWVKTQACSGACRNILCLWKHVCVMHEKESPHCRSVKKKKKPTSTFITSQHGTFVLKWSTNSNAFRNSPFVAKARVRHTNSRPRGFKITLILFYLFSPFWSTDCSLLGLLLHFSPCCGAQSCFFP